MQVTRKVNKRRYEIDDDLLGRVGKHGKRIPITAAEKELAKEKAEERRIERNRILCNLRLFEGSTETPRTSQFAAFGESFEIKQLPMKERPNVSSLRKNSAVFENTAKKA